MKVSLNRGFSVAQMAPPDAARLRTTLLASAMTNASVEAVQRYMQTCVDKSRSRETLFAATDLADLAGLPARHSFVDALEALIASAATGSLAALIADSKKRVSPHIEVFAFTRLLAFGLHLRDVKDLEGGVLKPLLRPPSSMPKPQIN